MKLLEGRDRLARLKREVAESQGSTTATFRSQRRNVEVASGGCPAPNRERGVVPVGKQGREAVSEAETCTRRAWSGACGARAMDGRPPGRFADGSRQRRQPSARTSIASGQGCQNWPPPQNWAKIASPPQNRAKVGLHPRFKPSGQK